MTELWRFRRLIPAADSCASHEILRADATRIATVADQPLLECATLESTITQLAQHAPNIAMRTGIPTSSNEMDDAAASLSLWGPGARAALETAVERATAVASRAGSRLLLWPHVSDVLSDIPTSLGLLRKFPDVGMILQPRDLLTQSMLPRAAEHFRRIFETFEDHPGIVAFANGCDTGEHGSAAPAMPAAAEELLQKQLAVTQKPVVSSDERPTH